MENLFSKLVFDYDSFIGRELGNVTIIKELGRGNRGVVFTGFQKSLKRKVAVKILPKIQTTTEEDHRRFMDEAEIIAVLSHPNIIPIFEMGEEKDFYFQVMQLITGSDLNKIIKKRLKHPVSSKQLLPVEQTVDIVIQVLDGLGYAHEESIIHQDIKPANILMEERRGRPLIADFGIAKTIQMKSNTPIDVIVGSPVYISPEQASAETTDKRTDIYSVGVMLFKMLTGELPRRKEKVAQILLRKIHEPDTFFTQSPSETSPLINSEMERIILSAIEPDMDKRYKDCRPFMEDLISYRKKYCRS